MCGCLKFALKWLLVGRGGVCPFEIRPQMAFGRSWRFEIRLYLVSANRGEINQYLCVFFRLKIRLQMASSRARGGRGGLKFAFISSLLVGTR